MEKDKEDKMALQDKLIETVLGLPESNSREDMADYLATRSAMATTMLAKTIVMTNLHENKPKMDEFIQLLVKNIYEEVEDLWQEFEKWKKEQENS